MMNSNNSLYKPITRIRHENVPRPRDREVFLYQQVIGMHK